MVSFLVSPSWSWSGLVSLDAISALRSSPPVYSTGQSPDGAFFPFPFSSTNGVIYGTPVVPCFSVFLFQSIFVGLLFYIIILFLVYMKQAAFRPHHHHHHRRCDFSQFGRRAERTKAYVCMHVCLYEAKVIRSIFFEGCLAKVHMELKWKSILFKSKRRYVSRE